MNRTMTPSNTECICPHCTADVVAIVHHCLALLGDDFKPHCGGKALDHLLESLTQAMQEKLASGVVLLKVWRAILTQQPQLGEKIEVSSEGNPARDFHSIANAVEYGRGYSEVCGIVREHRGGGFAELRCVSCFVVTPSPECAGQICHPRRLADELDVIASAWRAAKVPDAVGFLKALEEACLNAHANGNTSAGVAIYHTVDGVEFHSVHGVDSSMCEVQSERVRSGSRCVCIPVCQHEEIE